MEYASSVWDPYRKTHIEELEKVQRRAAPYATRQYGRDTSVTELQHQLGWPTLESRRKTARLVMFYKVVHHQVAIPLPEELQARTRTTRGYHQERYVRLSSSSDTYKYSFIPRTSWDWNQLPAEVIEQPSIDDFKAALATNI